MLELPARLAARLDRLRLALSPGEGAWTGAARGLAAATVIVLVVDTAQYCAGAAAVVAVVVGVPTGLLIAAALGGAIVLLVRLLAALPKPYRWVFWGSWALLLPVVFTGEPGERAWLVAIVVALASVTGAATALCFRASTRGRRVVSLGALGACLGAVLSLFFWYFGDGEPTPRMVDAASGTAAPPVALPDPSAPGGYKVLRLFYGSGTDRHRDEFGKDADLLTKPVDGSRFLVGWSGVDGFLRTRFWGFDAKSMPLNGRVWYPEGSGPFPVVLIVHGNHVMQEYSDTGYDYLGELLASRGFVFGSVDENFLNGAPWGKLGALGLRGIANENAARGVLLLEHLAAFRGWNEAENGPFYHKLDLGRVALIGHSRGGEAVAAAAAFNGMKHPPDDATISFDYGFGIRALVALSTSDRQYQPSGRGLRLRDVDFLALQGSNDADQEYFRGMQQYDRVSLTPGGNHFKAAAYVYRANHGQWNRAWGRRDLGQFQRKWLLDTTPLLQASEQEQVAKTYISAFLEASLHGQRGYLPVLRDHRVAAPWLPDTIYVNRYQDADVRIVSDFDEDVDVSTTTASGGEAGGESLTSWREQPLGAADRFADLENKAVYLGWDRGEQDGEPSYSVTLPRGFAVAASDVLTFGLADANESPLPPGRPRRSKAAPPPGPRAPIDLSVEVTDAAGHSARLALPPLQPQLQVTIWKTRLLAERRPESVLQTYDLPLARFVAARADLDAGAIRSVRLVFDRTPSGVVILDDVGFHPGS